jgi:hypothetical protein
MRTQKQIEAQKRREQIEELKLRRVKLWKIYHSLPVDDERREQVKAAAQGLYDGLRELGEI